jgi:hypothetical protein
MKLRACSVARMAGCNPEKYTIFGYKMKESNGKIAKNIKK